MFGIDDALLFGLLGGGLGALMNKKNPLVGALVGGTTGALGGGLLGGAGGAAAESPSLSLGSLGNAASLEALKGAPSLAAGAAPGLGTGGGALMMQGMAPGMAPGLGTGGGALAAGTSPGIASMLKDPRLAQMLMRMGGGGQQQPQPMAQAQPMQRRPVTPVNMPKMNLMGSNLTPEEQLKMYMMMKQRGLA